MTIIMHQLKALKHPISAIVVSPTHDLIRMFLMETVLVGSTSFDWALVVAGNCRIRFHLMAMSIPEWKRPSAVRKTIAEFQLYRTVTTALRDVRSYAARAVAARRGRRSRCGRAHGGLLGVVQRLAGVTYASSIAFMLRIPRRTSACPIGR